MWINNNGPRQQGKNRSQESSFLVVNLLEKNPALRISEKAKLELGWDNNDYVNIFVNRKQIMLMKDNVARNFAIRVYKTRDKSYGFNIYSNFLKDILRQNGWESQRDYAIEFVEDAKSGEKYLMCLKPS